MCLARMAMLSWLTCTFDLVTNAGLSDVARGEGTEKLSVTERKDEELLDAPTLSRQPTSEGNAAVAAVEEATGHSHTNGVKNESHGARAAAEEGDSGHGLADLLAQVCLLHSTGTLNCVGSQCLAMCAGDVDGEGCAQQCFRNP